MGKIKNKARPEERVPTLDYVERMKKLGPRPRESLLSFNKRMAALEAGRALVLSAWAEAEGRPWIMAERIGLNLSAILSELRRLGLTYAILSKLTGVQYQRKQRCDKGTPRVPWSRIAP